MQSLTNKINTFAGASGNQSNSDKGNGNGNDQDYNDNPIEGQEEDAAEADETVDNGSNSTAQRIWAVPGADELKKIRSEFKRPKTRSSFGLPRDYYDALMEHYRKQQGWAKPIKLEIDYAALIRNYPEGIKVTRSKNDTCDRCLARGHTSECHHDGVNVCVRCEINKTFPCTVTNRDTKTTRTLTGRKYAGARKGQRLLPNRHKKRNQPAQQPGQEPQQQLVFNPPVPFDVNAVTQHIGVLNQYVEHLRQQQHTRQLEINWLQAEIQRLGNTQPQPPAPVPVETLTSARTTARRQTTGRARPIARGSTRRAKPHQSRSRQRRGRNDQNSEYINPPSPPPGYIPARYNFGPETQGAYGQGPFGGVDPALQSLLQGPVASWIYSGQQENQLLIDPALTDPSNTQFSQTDPAADGNKDAIMND